MQRLDDFLRFARIGSKNLFDFGGWLLARFILVAIDVFVWTVWTIRDAPANTRDLLERIQDDPGVLKEWGFKGLVLVLSGVLIAVVVIFALLMAADGARLVIYGPPPTPTIVQTATLVPTETLVPTMTMTPTLTPEPTLTPSPTPTLNPEPPGPRTKSFEHRSFRYYLMWRVTHTHVKIGAIWNNCGESNGVLVMDVSTPGGSKYLVTGNRCSKLVEISESIIDPSYQIFVRMDIVQPDYELEVGDGTPVPDPIWDVTYVYEGAEFMGEVPSELPPN